MAGNRNIALIWKKVCSRMPTFLELWKLNANIHLALCDVNKSELTQFQCKSTRVEMPNTSPLTVMVTFYSTPTLNIVESTNKIFCSINIMNRKARFVNQNLESLETTK